MGVAGAKPAALFYAALQHSPAGRVQRDGVGAVAEPDTARIGVDVIEA
jgi:hypothetical protein